MIIRGNVKPQIRIKTIGNDVSQWNCGLIIQPPRMSIEIFQLALIFLF
uniref:Uncharacterized protein n=1 Tax=Siphoviridae sp. ctZHD14 TaxID=2827891 RepID=A0A8S5SW92_9CAUD|nr:MAG TPA: hypothetical protein [Siphoviridae sp. ctZHD14]